MVTVSVRVSKTRAFSLCARHSNYTETELVMADRKYVLTLVSFGRDQLQGLYELLRVSSELLDFDKI
jgi:hypothetical protein